MSDRVLVIPGLDGTPGVLQAAAPRLFGHLQPTYFDHHADDVDGGLEGMADRALALLGDEDEEPIFVCGESFGGTVALTLAHLYPSRVRGLILLSTFGWYPAAATFGGSVGMAVWERMGDDFANRLLRAWRPIGVAGALGFNSDREAVRVYLEQPDLNMAGYRTKCALSLRFDARGWLSEVTCPTFVLTGTWDPVVPVSAGRDLARRLPNATLYRLPGTHLVHLTRAADAGALLSRWVDRVATPGAPA